MLLLSFDVAASVAVAWNLSMVSRTLLHIMRQDSRFSIKIGGSKERETLK